MADPAYNAKAYRQALLAYRRNPPICAICGERTTPENVSVDHVRPVRAFPAGTPGSVISAISNLRPSHRSCNFRRGSKPARSTFSIQRDPRYR